MCRSTMASSCCVIQYLGLCQDGIPEIPAEKLRGIEVYLPSDKVGQLRFHVKKCETWHMAWLKLDEDINVTVRAEIIAQDRAEQRELVNMMSATEHFKLMCGNRQLGATHDYLLRVSAINTCASCHQYTGAWDILQALALIQVLTIRAGVCITVSAQGQRQAWAQAD